MIEQWEGFKTGKWCDEINVRDFIQSNYTEYTGDDKFLESPTEATNKLNDEIKALEGLTKKIGHTIQQALGLSARIKLVEPKTIERSMGKAVRVIDKRKFDN